MRRFFTALFLGVCLAVFALFIKRFQMPSARLTDGSKISLIEVFTGPYHNVNIERPWMKWFLKLPDSVRRIFPVTLDIPNSWERGWHTVPTETNSLHIWFKRTDALLHQAPSLDQNLVVLVDAEGWAWSNHGIAYANGGNRSSVDYLSYSFSGFPRWEEFLEFDFLQRPSNANGEKFSRVGEMRLRNSARFLNPARWPVQPLPQEVSAGEVEATLEGLTFQRNWDGEAVPKTFGTAIPLAQLKLTTIERQGGNALTNSWHEVNKAFFDNYGNNSNQGLPPRRASDTNSPPIQWRITVDLVADARSQTGSNEFLTLPRCILPSIGERLNMEAAGLESKTLKLWVAGLMGPGNVSYTNGVLEKMDETPAGIALPSSVQESSRISHNGRSTLSRVNLSSSHPHLAVGYNGDVEGLWFSLRAIDGENGKTVWLDSHADASKKPQFSRVYNDNRLVWYNCKGLDTTRAWNFVFGVHHPRKVSFYIERPSWDGEFR